MKLDFGKAAGLMVSVVAVLLLGYVVFNYDFGIFEFLGTRVEFVQSTASDVGQRASSFLWMYRVLDVLAQAFLVFVTAACCVAMLREE